MVIYLHVYKKDIYCEGIIVNGYNSVLTIHEIWDKISGCTGFLELYLLCSRLVSLSHFYVPYLITHFCLRVCHSFKREITMLVLYAPHKVQNSWLFSLKYLFILHRKFSFAFLPTIHILIALHFDSKYLNTTFLNYTELDEVNESVWKTWHNLVCNA